MAKKDIIRALDLFCGAGGTSTGIAFAAKKLKKNLYLQAVNHWSLAIASHSVNHPYAEHYCTGIDSVDPRKLVPSGRLDLLVASPECTHHSIARGGKPMNDQSRTTGWHILRFCEALYVSNVLIENVKEYLQWGPLGADGRPLKSKKGELFQQFIASFKALGYNVEYRVLNCADYGAPTSRERLFIIARRGNKKIVWPKPTHVNPTELATPSLFGDDLRPWRTARECIDWSTPSQSIWERKKPLASTTLKRIEAGLKKYNGIEVDLELCLQENLRPYVCIPRGNEANMKPFVSVLRNHGDARSTEQPLPTVTATGTHLGLTEPYIVSAGGAEGQGRQPHSVDSPLGTVLTNDRRALVEPFVLQTDHTGNKKTKKVRSIHEPVPTLVTKANTCVVEPFLLPNEGIYRGNRPRSVDQPVNTVTASRGAGHLVEPFLLPHPRKNDQPHSVDRPMRTVTATSSDMSLCEPFLIGQQSAAAPRGVDEPVPTVATAGAISLTEPFLVPNFGERDGQGPRSQSIDNPMPTVTASKGAGNLVIPYLVYTNHGDGNERRTAPLDEPMRTVTGSHGEALIEPFVIEYYGTGNMAGMDKPMPTVTGTDRFGLVEGVVVDRYLLDIRFRMLQPRELANAQGFPADYVFKGSKRDVVKQIGNAVPVDMAEHLALAVLSDEGENSKWAAA